MEERFCDRCDSKISYLTVSPGYFGVCETHDEDVFEFETHTKGKK